MEKRAAGTAAVERTQEMEAANDWGNQGTERADALVTQGSLHIVALVASIGGAGQAGEMGPGCRMMAAGQKGGVQKMVDFAVEAGEIQWCWCAVHPAVMD